jgi:hypothetical protein
MAAFGTEETIESSWRIGRLAGVKLTLSSNRRISAVDPKRTLIKFERYAAQSACRFTGLHAMTVAEINAALYLPASASSTRS